MPPQLTGPYPIALRADDVVPEIWDPLAEAFAEALGLDDDEVRFDARVIGDLGAESLDFLDIAFRLERAFDIKIPRGGIEQSARAESGEAYEVDGVLTPLGLEKLREVMPEVPREEFVEGLKTTQVPELFRVGTFYNLVVFLLNQKAEG